MSSNDLVLLNQLLDQRLSEIGQGLTDNEVTSKYSLPSKCSKMMICLTKN